MHEDSSLEMMLDQAQGYPFKFSRSQRSPTEAMGFATEQH